MTNIPKIDRKNLKTPDGFQQKGGSILESMFKYRIFFLVLVVFLTTGAVGTQVWDWFNDTKMNKGWAAFHGANKLEDKKWDELKKVANDYQSSRAGQHAATLLADHYFDEAKKAVLKDPKLNSPDAALAVEWYGKALQLKDLDTLEKGLLIHNRGQAYELQLKFDDAMKDYKEGALYSGTPKALALLGQGRIFELKNEKEQALKTYETVATDFLKTEFGKQARTAIRRLKNAALSPTPVG